MPNYHPYPEYKDSGIDWLGNIPTHWKISRIKFFAEINPSKTQVRNLPKDTEVSFLPMEAIGEDGSLKLDSQKQLGDVINGYTFVGENDLIIAKITPCFENGKSAIARGLIKQIAFATTEVIPLRCNNSDDTGFLYYLLKCSPFKNIAEGSMYGAGGQKRVADSFVANYHFAEPPIAERYKIAAFLDRETAKIDQLIAKQQQLIELLKEKRQAVISHAVTKGLNPNVKMKPSGVEWLGEVPDHWDVCFIKHKCQEITDGAHISPKTENGEHLFISITDIKKGVIDFENALLTSPASYAYLKKTGCMPFAGDILFSKDGTIGQTAITPSKVSFVVASSLIIVRPNRALVTSEYMDFLLKSSLVAEQVESFVKGAALRRLSIQNLLKIFGVFPPLEEQRKISNYLTKKLSEYDSLEENTGRQIELLRERRAALISAAVTGKIDVREVALLA